jgi:hypothetical protein
MIPDRLQYFFQFDSVPGGIVFGGIFFRLIIRLVSRAFIRRQ